MYGKLWNEVLAELHTKHSFEDKLKFLFSVKGRYLGGNTGDDARAFFQKLDNKIEEIKTLAALDKSSQIGLWGMYPPPSETERQKQIKFYCTQLTKYNFFHYLNVIRGIDKEAIKEIWKAITENKLPYIIALLYELGYVDYLKREYCQEKSNERDKLMGEILDSNPRNIRGNINCLINEDSDGKGHYTAYNHLEKIKDFLKNLK